jgi:hypothetical protein
MPEIGGIYRAMVGSLLYVANGTIWTHPDISFSDSGWSPIVSNPGPVHTKKSHLQFGSKLAAKFGID